MTQEQPPGISEERRFEVASRIAEEFNKFSVIKKREFVDETLTALVNMKKEKLRKMFSKLFFKKGTPTTRDLETINQLVVVFLHSIKDEFKYHYASMVYKALRIPLPEDLPVKLEEVRSLEWLHFGVSMDTAQRLYNLWEKRGKPDYDSFFTELLEAQHNVRMQNL